MDRQIIYWMAMGGLLGSQVSVPASSYLMKIGFVVIGIIGGWLIYSFIFKKGLVYLTKFSGQELLIKSIGLLFGILIGTLLTVTLKPFLEMISPIKSFSLILLMMMIITGIAVMVASAKSKEFNQVFFEGRPANQKALGTGSQFKILDTSAIIDGRIADLCKTGFLEGILIIPNFVLSELQKIADSADTLRRNRGRRGLDLLNRMQKEEQITLKVFDRDYENINDVDTKLLKLAREMEAKVVTNDFNLNKVAELYGVKVLNINELSNAIKPLVLPGEEMVVFVLRDGKEYGQGIGYLEDGTMIVVEGGRNYIGLSIEILVTSVLQTSAGRMIFAKPKELFIAKVTS